MMSNITNMETFKKAIKSAGSRGKNLVKLYRACMQFAYDQITDHGNSSPMMMLREAIPAFAAKPTGMSQKRLDSFAETFTGFAWNKASKSYQKTGANALPLPEQGVAFWDHAREQTESEFSLSQALANVIKRAHRNNLNDDEIIETFAKVAAELAEQSELNQAA